MLDAGERILGRERAAASVRDANVADIGVAPRSFGRRQDVEKIQPLVEGVAPRRADLAKDVDRALGGLAKPLRLVVGRIVRQA